MVIPGGISPSTRASVAVAGFLAEVAGADPPDGLHTDMTQLWEGVTDWIPEFTLSIEDLRKLLSGVVDGTTLPEDEEYKDLVLGIAWAVATAYGLLAESQGQLQAIANTLVADRVYEWSEGQDDGVNT